MTVARLPRAPAWRWPTPELSRHRRLASGGHGAAAPAKPHAHWAAGPSLAVTTLSAPHAQGCGTALAVHRSVGGR